MPDATAITQTIFPALVYADSARALEWLTEAFGAEARHVYRGDDGTIHHAELVIEGQMVMFGTQDPKGKLGGEPPQPLASPLSLYVVVSDPDAHHARSTAAGATVVRPLEDMEYGSREYSVRDLEGNLWSFGTYQPSA